MMFCIILTEMIIIDNGVIAYYIITIFLAIEINSLLFADEYFYNWFSKSIINLFSAYK